MEEKDMNKIFDENNTELLSATLYQNNSDCNDKNYYLRLEYLASNEYGKYKYIIPRVLLPIPKHLNQINIETIDYSDLEDQTLIKPKVISKASLKGTKCDDWVVLPDLFHKHFYEAITLEETRKEMTIEEIEQRLGYKIKIVDRNTKEYKDQLIFVKWLEQVKGCTFKEFRNLDAPLKDSLRAEYDLYCKKFA